MCKFALGSLHQPITVKMDGLVPKCGHPQDLFQNYTPIFDVQRTTV